MKNKLSILFITSVFALQAQKFSITPFIGVKAGVAVKNESENYDYSYFKTTVPRINTSNSPILWGLNLEYLRNKHLFGIGFVVGDDAKSTIKIEYQIISPTTNLPTSIIDENYAGLNVFKIPLSYKRELFSIKSKSEKKLISFRLHTGLNFQFLKIDHNKVLNNQKNFGEITTLYGDTLNRNGYSFHRHHSFSVSFNLGLDCDFYIKNKRKVNLQLYYEQGTAKISASYIIFYKDDGFNWGGNRSTSRGSAIHFKLAVPINLEKKKN